MRTFSYDSTNIAYARAWHDITKFGARVPSRNGDTLEVNPGIFEISDPGQRLITCVGRPVNVAFALAEVLWILAGRRDVEMLKPYNSKIDQWSDDGLTFNAPYGYRMREAHGFDQIEDVVRTLQADPGSRQAIINVWNPQNDRGWDAAPSHNGGVGDVNWVPHQTADRACNVLCHPMIREGRLNWLQIVRSNDLIWGVPYNFMQWMHVQEYIARRVGVEVGHYVHVSDSLHVYDFNRPESVELFDLYRETGQRHAAMLVSDDVMREVFRIEEKIRTSDKIWAPGSMFTIDETVGMYWKHVLLVLLGHRHYAAGNDFEAALCLTAQDSDPVLGFAQLKFYWQNRWKKQPKMAQVRIQDLIEDYITRLHDPRGKMESILAWFDDEFPES